MVYVHKEGTVHFSQPQFALKYFYLRELISILIGNIMRLKIRDGRNLITKIYNMRKKEQICLDRLVPDKMDVSTIMEKCKQTKSW